jgi:hypothetical protein
LEEVDLGSVTRSRGARAGRTTAAHEAQTKNRSRGTSKAQELPSAHFVLHYNPPFHTVAAPFAAAFGDWLGDFAPFADLYNTLFG